MLVVFGSNLVALVNIKIAGIYGWENPTNIDNIYIIGFDTHPVDDFGDFRKSC